MIWLLFCFFFSSRRRHTRCYRDWSSDVCSSDLRRATPRDLLLLQSWQSRQTEAMINRPARASELGLTGLKIVTAEYNYDGSRLALLFSTESDEKVDLKSLKRDMQTLYPNTHIEMRQIGPRDVAKIIGGMGACGLETRCCSMFLTEFSPISIKMAKEKGISP